MTTILTRAARALCKAQSGVDVYDDLEPEAQEAARDHVRAVLEACREPSEEMVSACFQSLFDNNSGDPIDDRTIPAAWRAAIDAALAD